MTTDSHPRRVPTITNETAIAWIGLYGLAVVMGFGRFLFTATLPDIMTQLALSTAIAGWLASVNYIGYFIGALIAMFVPQRLTWQALMLGTIMSIVTTTLLFVSDMPLGIWYVIRLFAGAASGIGMILGSSFVLQHFSLARRSVLSTLHYAGIGTGISLSALLSWWLLSLGYHFDIIWLIAGISSLPLLWLLYAIRPITTHSIPIKPLKNQSIHANANRQNRAYPSITQSAIHFKRALYHGIVGHTKAIGLLVVSYMLAGFGYITSATFLPVMASQQLTNQSYSGLLIWLIVGIFAMLSNPLWGALAKRIGESNTLISITVLQALGMLTPSLFEGAFGLYSNAVILGLTFVGIVSMTLTLIKNINPTYSNLLIGLATLAYAIGQLIGPLVTVALAGENNNFNAGLLVAGAGLVIGLVLLLLFRQHQQHP